VSRWEFLMAIVTRISAVICLLVGCLEAQANFSRGFSVDLLPVSGHSLSEFSLEKATPQRPERKLAQKEAEKVVVPNNSGPNPSSNAGKSTGSKPGAPNEG